MYHSKLLSLSYVNNTVIIHSVTMDESIHQVFFVNVAI